MPETSLPPGVELRGEMLTGFDEILTRDALEFIGADHGKHVHAGTTNPCGCN